MRQKGNGFAVWLTGLPSSGKTGVSRELHRHLREHGIAAHILDSDELRGILTPHARYSAEERDWFYGVLVFLMELLTKNGVNVLVAATGPRRAYREAARSRIERFAEVHVDCPVEVCKARDPKGLWARAEKGEIQTLPGVGEPYEAPLAPDLRIDTGKLTPEEAAGRVLTRLRQMNFF